MLLLTNRINIKVKVCFVYRKKERNVLFKDALNTFYLQLYGVRHNVKDHPDSNRGSLLPPLHAVFFLISSKDFLYAPSDRQDSTYNSLCYTSCGVLAGTRNNSIMRDRSDNPLQTFFH